MEQKQKQAMSAAEKKYLQPQRQKKKILIFRKRRPSKNCWTKT